MLNKNNKRKNHVNLERSFCSTENFESYCDGVHSYLKRRLFIKLTLIIGTLQGFYQHTKITIIIFSLIYILRTIQPSYHIIFASSFEVCQNTLRKTFPCTLFEIQQRSLSVCVHFHFVKHFDDISAKMANQEISQSI